MKKVLFVIGFVALSFGMLRAQTPVYTLGPMIHIYFGQDKTNLGVGFEGAIYSRIGGIDLGFELRGRNLILYTEYEYSKIFYGLAAGPFIQLKNGDNKFLFGIQGSLWANFFFGLDYRLRGAKNFTEHGPGMYFKQIYQRD